jgi:predicted RNase H-like nuclease (RuvC/YqgF family)
MNDIRDAIVVVLSDNDGNSDKYDSSIDAMVDSIRSLITPELDKRAEQSEQHERHADNCEDHIASLEAELEDSQGELAEVEVDTDWLKLVQMFRAEGGYAHDITYGQKAKY